MDASLVKDAQGVGMDRRDERLCVGIEEVWLPLFSSVCDAYPDQDRMVEALNDWESYDRAEEMLAEYVRSEEASSLLSLCYAVWVALDKAMLHPHYRMWIEARNARMEAMDARWEQEQRSREVTGDEGQA